MCFFCYFKRYYKLLFYILLLLFTNATFFIKSAKLNINSLILFALNIVFKYNAAAQTETFAFFKAVANLEVLQFAVFSLLNLINNNNCIYNFVLAFALQLVKCIAK